MDLVAEVLLFTESERQDARARYRERPGPSLYTADFTLLLRGQRETVVEVKLDTHLGDDIYRDKLRRAKDIIGRHGRDFSVVAVPADECHPIWANVALISQATRRRDLWPSPEVIERLEQLGQRGARTAGDFLNPLNLSTSHLPHFLVAGALRADILSHPMRASTPVELAYGDLSHLQLIARLQR
ncbi:MAG: hypothetical protein IPG93_10190 [Burkholderiales bacterium]|nr:hypothetical protein [Burkholderiales bacterium]